MYPFAEDSKRDLKKLVTGSSAAQLVAADLLLL
jgi:hypothetical protein